MSWLFRSPSPRQDRITEAETRLDEVIRNLDEATGRVQRQVHSLSEVAERLTELREVLDHDRIGV